MVSVPFFRRGTTTMLGWILFLMAAPLGQAQETCDQCSFADDEGDDCRVYGKIDGELTSWTKAPQACLDSYNIKITGVDPFSSGCDPPSATTFVNSGIKGGVLPNSVLAGLGENSGGFFDVKNKGEYVLKLGITIDGKFIPCQRETSTCYAAMREYFADGEPGEQERKQVCETIFARVANDRELEQSSSRIRVCEDIRGGVAPSTSCGALVQEVQAAIDDKPDKICAGFAFGTGSGRQKTTTTPVVAPGCGEALAKNETVSASSANTVTIMATGFVAAVLTAYRTLQ